MDLAFLQDPRIRRYRCVPAVTYRQVDSSLYLHTRLQEKTLGGARLLTRLGTDTRPGLEGKIGMQDHCTDQLYISTARYYLLARYLPRPDL